MSSELKSSDYDNGYPFLYNIDGDKCAVERVIDITEECPKATKDSGCLLLFSRSVKGQLVAICTCNREKRVTSYFIHYVLLYQCKKAVNGEAGLNADELTKIILAHVPQ